MFRSLITFATFSIVAATTCNIDNSAKSDCGYTGITQSQCQSKGCCWVAESQNSAIPWCYYPGDSTPGYSLSSVTQTANGFVGTLNKIGSGTNMYGTDIKTLSFSVVFETDTTMRIKINDAVPGRWQIPQSILPTPDSTTKPSNMKYSFTYVSSPFSFTVKRVSDGRIVFSSSSNLIFKNQYLELTTSLSNWNVSQIFGLGESARTNLPLNRGGHIYTLWAVDQPSMTENVNLYGSYPFFLQLEKGSATGAMMLNSNGMDVVLNDASLTYKMIGGVIDLYLFVGPSPSEVVSQMTQVIGRPALVPYWSLGFHNCKYGYSSLQEIEDVVAGYAAAKIPLDTQWADIDYMDGYRDFSADPKNFPVPQFKSFVDQLHNQGQHFVVIIDPGIKVDSGYPAYDQGMSDKLFVKDLNGGYYMSQVWPGPTYMPDFFNPVTQNYWTDNLQSFFNLVPVDGFWIDMNEISNFCNVDGHGQVCANTASSGCPLPNAQTTCCLVCSTPQPSNTLDFPPYNIHSVLGLVATKTMAMSATHYGNVSVYNAHNLYGLTEQIATQAASKAIRGKRPFTLTRSGFLSTGVHSAKWTGDNGATWDDLKTSIVGIIDFNLFGVPMIGADICGFLLDTTEELCARWIEVGAFYPFSRDHNTLGASPQELYLWPSVASASQKALGLRYQILPYLYTLFYSANVYGTTVARALWMNFPADVNTALIQRQFMLGPAVISTPVLDQGQTSVSGYFPQGYWFNLFTYALDVDASAGGKTVSFYTPLTETNVHLYGGNILPTQGSALTTTAARQTPFNFLTALNPSGTSAGQLFWDDGEQIDVKNYLFVDYAATYSNNKGTFTATVKHDSYTDASKYLVGTVTVLGKSLVSPSSATLTYSGGSRSNLSIKLVNGYISISNINLAVNTPFTLTWQ